MSYTNPRPYYIAATGNLAIGGEGVRVYSVNINTGAASGVLTLYDGVDATTGKKVAVINATAATSFHWEGALFLKGCFAVLSGGNADVTIIAG